MSALTAERLRAVLRYDMDTGEFAWRVAQGSAVPGRRAGTINGKGYRLIRIDGVVYSAHRLAWLYVRGEWPVRHIDHIDCNKLNSAFSNLREATNSQNMANAPLRCDNTSGFKGVTRRSHAKSWEARVGGTHIGFFKTATEAHAAYVAKARELYGEFARVA